MEVNAIVGIPQAALDKLVRRLKMVASLSLPSSQQKFHLVEFVQVHVINQGYTDSANDGGAGAGMIEKNGRTLDLFCYLTEQGIASPDIFKEVFQRFFPDQDEQQGQHQQNVAPSPNPVQSLGALQPPPPPPVVVADQVPSVAPHAMRAAKKPEKKRPATDRTSVEAKKKRKLPMKSASKVVPQKHPSRWGAPDNEGWEPKFELLREYQRENGHCRIPNRSVFKPVKLGQWVKKQRECYKNFMVGSKPASITQKRIDKLNSIGFDWFLSDLPGEAWNRKYELLLDFQRENGHCRVPKRCVVKNVKLGLWVNDQRRYYKNFKQGNDKNASITLDRIGKLNAIGLEWTVVTQSSAKEAPALEMACGKTAGV